MSTGTASLRPYNLVPTASTGTYTDAHASLGLLQNSMLGTNISNYYLQRLKHTPQAFAFKFLCAQGHTAVAGTTPESHRHV